MQQSEDARQEPFSVSVGADVLSSDLRSGCDEPIQAFVVGNWAVSN